MNNEVDYSKATTDPDLAAHFEYVIKRGVSIFGKSIEQIFEPIPWHYFITGIQDDFDWIVEDEHILETPFYAILNICRTIMTLSSKHEEVFSKDEGAAWALQHFPEIYHLLIQKALDVYHSDKPVTSEAERKQGGTQWDRTELLAFRDFARNEVKELARN